MAKGLPLVSEQYAEDTRLTKQNPLLCQFRES